MHGGWLHVVCGDSAAMSLRASGAVDPGAIRVQHDVLSVGPLPPFGDLARWKRTRLDFWRAAVWPEAPALEEMPGDLVASAAELPDTDGVVVWVGGALSDQLLLPSTDRIAQLAGAPELSIKVVRFSVTGLGVVAPEALRRHEAPSALDVAAQGVLRRVWEGITAPDAERLLEAIALSAEVGPELHRALGFFVTKYPDVRTGLARWDEELLRHAPGTPVELVGRALRANEAWLDPVGDLVLYACLRRLADPGLPHPALEPRGEDLLLTPFGEDVLAGRKNFVDHNGIDTWVAGVHLDAAAGRVWFRQGADLVRAGG